MIFNRSLKAWKKAGELEFRGIIKTIQSIIKIDKNTGIVMKT